MDATRQDLVTAHVRRAIMTGHLHPGDRLIEQTLAAELRMSRGPVRDALRLLEQEGLVQIYRNRGAIVSMLGLRDAYEFYLVRGHLESLAVRLARDHMQPADIAYLQSLVGKMADLEGAEEDWLVAADLDLAFHRRIVACSQNRSLIQSYGAMDVKINALFITVKQYLPARFAQNAGAPPEGCRCLSRWGMVARRASSIRSLVRDRRAIPAAVDHSTSREQWSKRLWMSKSCATPILPRSAGSTVHA